jgi:hypothetical protein
MVIPPMNIPADDNALLSGAQLEAAYAELGLPMKATTLERKRCVGGGPPFIKYEKIVRYRWGEARAWRLAQGRPMRSTSEALGNAAA